MKRPRPVSLGEVREGTCSYVASVGIPAWTRTQDHAFLALVDNVPVCAWNQKTSVKAREPFARHQHDDDFVGLLADCAEQEVYCPGSYAAIFRALYQTPRVKRLWNTWLERGFAGGWEECYEKGWHPGPLYCYDITSAYLWAALQGLPHPDAVRITRRIPERNGVALARAIATADKVPLPWASGERRLGVVLPGDVERFELRALEIYLSLEWDPSAEIIDGIEATLRRIAGCYDILRKLFWGVWAPSKTAKTASAYKGRITTVWDAPDRWTNILYAALIVGRVKQRIWAASDRAVEIFIDSVLTTERLVETEGLGGWRLDAEFPDGLLVRGPRQWQAKDGSWIKHAGMPAERSSNGGAKRPEQGTGCEGRPRDPYLSGEQASLGRQ